MSCNSCNIETLRCLRNLAKYRNVTQCYAMLQSCKVAMQHDAVRTAEEARCDWLTKVMETTLFTSKYVIWWRRWRICVMVLLPYCIMRWQCKTLTFKGYFLAIHGILNNHNGGLWKISSRPFSRFFHRSVARRLFALRQASRKSAPSPTISAETAFFSLFHCFYFPAQLFSKIFLPSAISWTRSCRGRRCLLFFPPPTRAFIFIAHGVQHSHVFSSLFSSIFIEFFANSRSRAFRQDFFFKFLQARVRAREASNTHH